MNEIKQLPEGAFVPVHGRGWLKPGRPFVKGDPRGKGNKAHNGYGKVTRRKAAESIARLWPALAEALRTPAPSKRSWWQKRQNAISALLQGNQTATDRYMLALMLLRTPAERIATGSDRCPHCGQIVQGEALPLVAGALVSAWVHPRCLAPAMQVIVRKARLDLAKALEPWK